MTYKIPKPPITEVRETPQSLLNRAYALMCNSENVLDHTEILLDREDSAKYYFGFTTHAKVCYNIDHINDQDEFQVLVDDKSGNLMVIYVPSGHDQVLEFSQFADFCGLGITTKQFKSPFSLGESYLTVKCLTFGTEKKVAECLITENYEFLWDCEKFTLPLGPGAKLADMYYCVHHLFFKMNGINSGDVDILVIPKS